MFKEKSDIVIEVIDLSVSFGKRKVLNNISYKFENNGFYSIVGHSGSGKTTFLNCIGGIIKPTSGKIIYNDKDLCSFNSNQLRENICGNVSFIFQDFNLIDELSVRDNLLLGVEPEEVFFNDMINKMNLDMVVECKVKTLSGGEKQRVAIARGIIRQSKIIIVDEPTGNLDEGNAKIIFDYLSFLSKTRLVIMVTHDMVNAERYSDKIIKIEKGNIQVIRDNDVSPKKDNEEETKDSVVNTVSYLSFKQIIKLLLGSISNKKILISLMILLIAIASSLFTISGTLAFLKKDDSVYRIIDDYNPSKDIFSVSTYETYDGGFIYFREDICKGKKILDDFKDYCLAKGYIEREMLYLQVDNYNKIKLESGRYPSSENEVLVSEKLSKTINDNTVSFKDVDYIVTGICVVNEGRYDDIIVSTNKPKYDETLYTKFLNSIGTEAMYYKESDFVDIEALSGNRVVVSTQALSFFSLEIGKKYKTKDIYDEKYNGVFNVYLNAPMFIGTDFEVVGTFESSNIAVIVDDSVYDEMKNYYDEYLSFDQLFIIDDLSKNLVSNIYNYGYEISDNLVDYLSFNENILSNTVFLTIPISIIALVILIISLTILIKTMIQNVKREIGIIKCLGIKYRYIFFQLLIFSLAVFVFVSAISLLIYGLEINLLNTMIFIIKDYPQYRYLSFNLLWYSLPINFIVVFLVSIFFLSSSRLSNKEIKKLFM